MPFETNTAITERRREIRREARGRVRLWPEALDFSPIDGQLMDVASGGFRARHEYMAMATGQMMGFEYEGARGRARVVWNRILGPLVESGFQVVPDPPIDRNNP